jgi:hypothetical protein
MSNLFTASVSACSAANFNRLLYLGGSKTGVKIIGARIRYNGSAIEVHSSTDSIEIVTGNLSGPTTGVVTLTVSGFTTIPLPLAGPNIAGGYIPFAVATAASTIQIRWYDFAGALVTSAGTNMDCNLIVIGS